MEEGRVLPVNSPAGIKYAYEYTLKDHLGNSRVTYYCYRDSVKPRKVQVTEYYPFGLVMKQYNTEPEGIGYEANKYLYNGKELQSDNLVGSSLNLYDYGARFYDPQIGRFTTLDPAAELGRRWSPYTYTFDNPMRFTDPDGLWPDFPDPFNVVLNQVKGIWNEGVARVSSFIDRMVDICDGKEVGTIGNASDIVESGAMILKESAVRNAAGQIGNAIDFINAAANATNTNFSDSEETADFVENTVQTTIENVAGPLGPGVHMILEDSKSDRGVTNMENIQSNFQVSNRGINSYIYLNFALKNKQAAEERGKKQKAYEERQRNQQAYEERRKQREYVKTVKSLDK